MLRAALVIAGLLSAGTAQAQRPLALDEALAAWKRLCVDPLPAKQGFIDAFNFDQRNGIAWTKAVPAERSGAGSHWRSRLGNLTYVFIEGEPLDRNSPACHFAFVPEADVAHAAIAAALRETLQIGAGIDTGSRREPQTCWEVDWKPELHIRIFLSFDSVDFGKPGARLSVSVRRLPAGERQISACKVG